MTHSSTHAGFEVCFPIYMVNTLSLGIFGGDANLASRGEGNPSLVIKNFNLIRNIRINSNQSYFRENCF